MASKIGVELHGLKFNVSGFKKQVRLNVENARKAVALEFIRHMLRTIPVWSGAAQATLLPLAEELGISIGIPNKPIVTNQVDNEHGIAAGIQHGHAKTTQYGFEWSQDLRHFDIQDPAVWHALDTATPVLKDFIRRKVRSIVPSMHSHIEKVNI